MRIEEVKVGDTVKHTYENENGTITTIQGVVNGVDRSGYYIENECLGKADSYYGKCTGIQLIHRPAKFQYEVGQEILLPSQIIERKLQSNGEWYRVEVPCETHDLTWIKVGRFNAK